MDQENINNQTTPAIEKQNIKEQSSLRGTILLIFILATVTAFFLYIALNPYHVKTSTKIANIPTPTPYAHTIISLVAAPTASNSANSNTVDINVNSGINTVNVVQLEIAFNPKVISKITLQKGTFFTNPVELLNDINYQDGRINYALGIAPKQTGVKGSGTLAILTYEINPISTASAVTFTILPKSLVASQGTVFSTLKSINNFNIPLTH